MGFRGVGFWKKIKALCNTVKQSLPKVFNWANKVYRENKDKLQPYLQKIPGNGIVTTLIDTASDLGEKYAEDHGLNDEATQKMVDKTTQVINDIHNVATNSTSKLDAVNRVNDIFRERTGLNNRYGGQVTSGNDWSNVKSRPYGGIPRTYG